MLMKKCFNFLLLLLLLTSCVKQRDLSGVYPQKGFAQTYKESEESRAV
jgi:hypothetical protein